MNGFVLFLILHTIISSSLFNRPTVSESQQGPTNQQMRIDIILCVAIKRCTEQSKHVSTLVLPVVNIKYTKGTFLYVAESIE